VALMTLWERGAFQLDDPIHKAFPEFAEPKVWVSGRGEEMQTEAARRPISYRDVLTHTAGLTYGGILQEIGIPGEEDPIDAAYRALTIRRDPAETLEAFMGKIAKAPLKYHPGEKWMYSLATDVVGALVERLSGRSLDRFLDEEILQPLGMKETGFHVRPDQADRFAACYGRGEDKKLKVVDGVAKSPFLQPPAFLSGGGGLVSTMGDYHRFCEMLRRGGELDGERIIGSRTLDLMTENHLPGGGDLTALAIDSFSETMPKGVGFGLGFAMTVDGVRAGSASEGEFYWGGAASTAFWVDPFEDLVVIFLTQLIPSTTYNFRGQLRNLVYAAIEE
jgi:CubicO group peptidase (beta-lactamase class C family)